MKSKIHNQFMKILKATHASPGFQRILNKDIGLEHYASFMRQVFHYARLNPKIQAMTTMYFPGDYHQATRQYFMHAASEIGHDVMALNDIKALGYDVDQIPFEKPLSETTALIAFPFYQIQHVNPLGHLGYMYFLEYLATTDVEKFVQAFSEIGVGEDALSFIAEHVAVDVEHNNLLENYIETFVKTEADADEVIYGIQTTAKLYDLMLQAAFNAVDNAYDYSQFCKSDATENAAQDAIPA